MQVSAESRDPFWLRQPMPRPELAHWARTAIIAVLVSTGASLPLAAQQTGSIDSAPANADGVRGSLSETGTDLDDAKRKLEGVETDLSGSVEQRQKLEADLEVVRTDRLRLNAALLETTEKVHAAESKVAETEARLDTLGGSEEAINHSLEGRRALIAEVLASLQRMGRKPPPAILVRPDDILKTIRTSMMLGAVLPELRTEAETLAADLEELSRVRQSIASDRDTLRTQLADLRSENTRLRALVEARQASQAEAEASLDSERQHAAELARQATSLKDLIGRMENDTASARKAADAAHAADEAQRKAAEADANSIREKVAAGPFRDPARLQPAVSFADTKGLLPLPTTGRILKSFGQADEFGGTEKGLSLSTPPRALVSAPADGWVAFSGSYRTYGQVLILNMGGGYYTVLAGMEHIDVSLGQFVLSGEPVGSMGDGSVKAAAAIALGGADPVLYVEFRKDGVAVDPSPWWAKAAVEKVRG